LLTAFAAGKPSRRARLAVALALAAGWGAYAALHAVANDTRGADFRHVWLAARALLAGLEPYGAVAAWEAAAGASADGKAGFYYPLPAAFAALPLAELPAVAAGVLVFTIGTFVAAYFTTRERWAALACVAGPSMVVCAQNLQVTPWLVAAMVAPGAAWAVLLVLVKPTSGSAAFLYRPTRRRVLWAVLGGGLLCVVALLLEPRWPLEWVAQGLKGGYARSALFAAWFAPLIILPAALRWRRREARVFLGLGVVPHTLFWADEMLLAAIIPRTWREAFYGTMASHLIYQAWHVQQFTAHRGIFVAWEGVPWSVVGLYLPWLVVLLRRPNAPEPDCDP